MSNIFDRPTTLAKGMLVNLSSQAYWKSNDLLTTAKPLHIKAESLGEFWPNRFALPADLLSVLAHLMCQSKGIVADSWGA
jgi:hypothetical protein